MVATEAAQVVGGGRGLAPFAKAAPETSVAAARTARKTGARRRVRIGGMSACDDYLPSLVRVMATHGRVSMVFRSSGYPARPVRIGTRVKSRDSRKSAPRTVLFGDFFYLAPTISQTEGRSARPQKSLRTAARRARTGPSRAGDSSARARCSSRRPVGRSPLPRTAGQGRRESSGRAAPPGGARHPAAASRQGARSTRRGGSRSSYRRGRATSRRRP